MKSLKEIAIEGFLKEQKSTTKKTRTDMKSFSSPHESNWYELKCWKLTRVRPSSECKVLFYEYPQEIKKGYEP